MTEVIKTGNEGGGDPVGSTVAPLVEVAREVGAAGAAIENHGEAIANHATDISHLKTESEWTRSQISDLGSQVASLPETVRAEVTSTLEAYKDELLTAVQSTLAPESGEKTDPPPPVANKAPKETGGVLGWMRRLV